MPKRDDLDKHVEFMIAMVLAFFFGLGILIGAAITWALGS